MVAYKWGWNPKYTEIYLQVLGWSKQTGKQWLGICLFDACNKFLKNLLPNGGEQWWFFMARSLKITRKKKKKKNIQDGRGIGDSFPRKPSWVIWFCWFWRGCFFLAPSRSPQHLNPFIHWKQLKYGNRFAHISCKGPSPIKHQNLGGP